MDQVIGLKLKFDSTKADEVVEYLHKNAEYKGNEIPVSILSYSKWLNLTSYSDQTNLLQMQYGNHIIHFYS